MSTLAFGPEVPRKYSVALWLALVAAGLAGNFFKYPLFLNIDFLFGSIFAMLALQTLGLGRGILAGAVIAGYTYFLWNHPYAVVIMTAEVAVVGWLMQRRRMGMVMADTLYWIVIGIPMVFVFYRFVMQASMDTSTITMTKQAVNGITNALFARLIFIGFSVRSNTQKTSFRELIYNLMAFFVLCPALLMLAIGSSSDFNDTDQRVRKQLSQEKVQLTEVLSVWVNNRKSALLNLANIAAEQSSQEMQTHLEQAQKSDVNFLRVGLVDNESVTTAFFPLIDELGQKNIGMNLADRPFVPVLKQTLKPALTDVFMSRIGTPKPIVSIVVPVLSHGNYQGFITGVLSLDQIRDQLGNITGADATLYTLLDRQNHVILTNRKDQSVMQSFVRPKGTLSQLDSEVSQWVPDASANKPIAERWKNSFYVAESGIGSLSDWKLVLDQPIGPFQKALFDSYTDKLSLLFFVLLGSLALAELVSRKTVRTLEQLSVISLGLTLAPTANGEAISWPKSSLLQTHQLIENFKAMSESLKQQFVQIRLINETLEIRVAQRTALLQGILDTIPVGLSAFDAKLELIAHNRLFREMLELPDSLLDKAPTRFEDIIRLNAERGEYGPGDHEVIVQDTVNRASHPVPHQFERVRPNGVALEIRGAPMAGGGFVTTYADISERKRAELTALGMTEQLREGEARARDFSKSASDWFWETDAQHCFCYFSESFETVYGMAIDQWLGKSRKELMKLNALNPPELVEAHLAQLDAHLPFRNFEYRTRTGAGEIVWVMVAGVPHVTADGRFAGYRGTGTVITERKQKEEALQQATLMAEAANIAKSRFLATMSHEIRTPMNGVLGMAQLLLMPNLTETERRDYARIILSSGQALLTLLNDILDLSKIEAGKFELDLSAFDPQSLLHETQTLFSGAAQAKDLHLKFQWHGVCGQRYQADSNRLRQMLSNLVGNAIKFTPAGEIQMQAIEIERDGGSALLEFSVSDSGIGIAADKLDVLFKPFSQTDSSTTRQYGGSGLGLSIVRQLAQVMGGRVGVESVPGQGSRFWFQVRVQIVAAADESRRAERSPVPQASSPDAAFCGKVLVAEDNLVNRLVIQTTLEKLGLQVVMAHDGLQALDAMLQGEVPDVVLMDVNMPVLDGYVATERIRQWESENGRARVPIIALTADAFEEDQQHCLAVGMDDFLTKPVAVDSLKSALRKWLPKCLPQAPGVADAAITTAAMDRQQFVALVAEISPLLEYNKFDAIARFKQLQTLAQGSAQEAEIEDIALLLQSLSFERALVRLRAMVAQL